jgi:2-iminobutanoate/2-iminopropanoate deaminase
MRKTALAVSLAGLFAMLSHADDTARKYVEPPKVGANPAAPFSNGVMVGETFYVAGHIGIDSATGQAATNVENEARLVMDSVKHTLEQAGLKTDDLVSVTVYCTDLDLYDKFNAVYRTYFHGHYPARAFIGINKWCAERISKWRAWP